MKAWAAVLLFSLGCAPGAFAQSTPVKPPGVAPVVASSVAPAASVPQPQLPAVAASRPRPPAVRDALNARPPGPVGPAVKQITIPLSKTGEKPASIRTSKIPPVTGNIDDAAARCMAAATPEERAACQVPAPVPAASAAKKPR